MEETDPRNKTPSGGAFSEAAAFVRWLVSKGKMTPEEGQALTEKAYRAVMLGQLNGELLGMPEELPEYLAQFPGATDKDGNPIFSDDESPAT